MIGVLVVTHGIFGEELINSLTLIAGHYEKCESLALKKEDDISELSTEIREKVDELNDGDGVIILVDIFGASPFNASVECLKKKNVELVTGVNLPMLYEALESRESSNLKKLVDSVINTSKEGITDVRKKMGI